MSKIRVVVADDHAVLRSGLKLLINSQRDMEFIGEAASHHDALDKVIDLRPDILVLDITMPGGTAAKVIETIVKDCQPTRVIVLTMHDDPAYCRVAMAAGAFGFITKKSADTELLDAIRCVAKNRIYGTNVFASTSEKKMATVGVRQHRSIEALSDREQTVLIMVAQGYTNQAIADRLDLSVKTVESYRSRLMTKLGLKSRAEMTKLAFESGLLGD